MGSIGYPDEYEAWVIAHDIVAGDLVYANLPWSTISWQRTRNTTSVASVTVPGADGGIDCCAPFGGLMPWIHMLAIFRNGAKVWDGPITSWSRSKDSRSVTIGAHDRSIILSRRCIAADADYVDAELLDVLGGIIDDVFLDTTVPYTYDMRPSVLGGVYPSGILISRSYRVAPLQKRAAAIAEIMDAYELSWTQLLDTIHFDPKAFWSKGTTAYVDPVLNESTIVGDLPVDVDAIDLSTVVFMGGTGQGVTGFANIITATNNTYLSFPLHEVITDSAADANAPSAISAEARAALNAAPKVTIEQVQLSPNFGSPTFPNDLSMLVPGAQYRLDFPETCALNTPIISIDYLDYEIDPVFSTSATEKVRLDQLDVTVTRTSEGLDETVLAGLSAIAGP